MLKSRVFRSLLSLCLGTLAVSLGGPISAQLNAGPVRLSPERWSDTEPRDNGGFVPSGAGFPGGGYSGGGFSGHFSGGGFSGFHGFTGSAPRSTGVFNAPGAHFNQSFSHGTFSLPKSGAFHESAVRSFPGFTGLNFGSGVRPSGEINQGGFRVPGMQYRQPNTPDDTPRATAAPPATTRAASPAHRGGAWWNTIRLEK